MPIELWTPRQLFMLRTDERFDQIPSHFLDTYFTETHYSADKEILIGELPAADRRMAPFVLPTEQGKPIFRQQGEHVRSLTPPYLKPKDAVRAVEARNPRITEMFRGQPLSMKERFDLKTAEIMAYHIRTIRMREAWMATRAFIDGEVTITYEREQGTAFPEVTIDFNRDSGHTVVKNADYWSAAATKILDDIETWADTMHGAVRGGYPTRLYLGSSVYKHFRNNTQVLAELDTQRRGTAVDTPTGIITGPGVHNPMTFMGTVGNGIEIFAYRDQVEQANGTYVELLGAKDVLLVAPGATGVRAYGAIYNAKAIQNGGYMSTDIFGSQWTTDDPSDVFMMHESAPLPIPLYPNRTLKATVLA